jgi:hypothetical protein
MYGRPAGRAPREAPGVSEDSPGDKDAACSPNKGAWSPDSACLPDMAVLTDIACSPSMACLPNIAGSPKETLSTEGGSVPAGKLCMPPTDWGVERQSTTAEGDEGASGRRVT